MHIQYFWCTQLFFYAHVIHNASPSINHWTMDTFNGY